jgi:chromosome segregation ATPase
VRDGEVPVTVLRRDHQPAGEHDANQLDAARQAVRSEASARERAERSLAEVEVSIRHLQTKLAHERLAKDEALEAAQRAQTEALTATQAQETAEAELAAERLVRRDAEDALAEALEARQEAESRLQDAMAVREARMPPQAHLGLADASTSRRKALATQDADDAEQIARAAGLSKTMDDGASTIQARRRGRPAKVGNQDSDIVEWWKPRSTSTGDTDMGGTSRKRGRGRPKGSRNHPKP